jgi:hypothetical protein
LSDGHVKNVGHPYDLICDTTTVLHYQLQKLTKVEAVRLIDIARTHYRLFKNEAVESLTNSLKSLGFNKTN